jgi:membrane-associated protease RseP (regulator of RpoE activity)
VFQKEEMTMRDRKWQQGQASTRWRAWLTAVITAAVMSWMMVPAAMAQLPIQPPSVPSLPDVKTPDVQRPDTNAAENIPADVEGKVKSEADVSGKGTVAPKAVIDTDVKAGVKADAGVGALPQVSADQRSQFGVQFGDDDGRLMINQVQSGSIAARAGLQANDEIVAVNGLRVSSQVELNSQLQAAARANGSTTVFFWRDGQFQQAQVNLAAGGFGANVRTDTFFRGPDDGPPPPPLGFDGDGQFDSRTPVYYENYAPRNHHRFWRRGCGRR